MGDEAIISRIAHRGIEKSVDLQRAALLVHLVFDRLAADWHLNDDVHVVGRILADWHSAQVHVDPPEARPSRLAVMGEIGSASIPVYRRNDRSAKAESDSIARLAAERLARAAQHPAAQPA